MMNFPYSVNVHFNNPDPFDVVYNNSNANMPVYHALGGINLVNPALYTAASGSNGPSHNKDTEYGGVVNFALPLGLAGEGDEFKFGASLRERTRTAQQYVGDLNPVSENLTDYVSGPDIFYYKGEYNLGPQPIWNKLLAIPQSPLEADPSTFEHDNENVYAGYAQYSTTFGQFDVVGGVRVENTDGTYRANTLTTDVDGNTTITPNTAKHTYTNLFPDISLKYRASDVLQFRAALSTAIARPGFNQITAARTVDLQNATPIVTQGNPELHPTLGHSVHSDGCKFLPRGGIASAGVFYKDFSDYIVGTEQLNDTSVPGFVGQKVDLISFSNIGSAHVAGADLR